MKKLRKFVYAASSSCYGLAKNFPTKESDTIAPEYPYALTKFLGEELVMHWGKVYDLPVISLRCFNIYGTRSRTSGTYGAVMGVFLSQKINQKPFTVVGNGNQRRDFTYVDDVVDADDGTFWNEPETPYAAQYPYNHVMETEGGHIKEYDDTVDNKRIHERHASGSGYEIFNDGTKVTRVKKDNYEIVSADEYCHIQGIARQTIDKGLRVKVNNLGQASNNYTIEVGAGANVSVEVQNGDINLISQLGDVNLKAGKNMNIDVAQALNIKVGGAITETSKSKTETADETHQMNANLQDINGNKIELN